MKISFLSLCLLFLQATSALGSWQNIANQKFELPNPPGTGSAQEKAELKVLLDFQNSDRKQQCTTSGWQLSSSFSSFWEHSDLLSDNEFRGVKKVMDQVTDASEKIVSRLKKQYQRPRPYVTYQEVRPCILRPAFTSKSYPSGHATASSVQACILAKKFPDRAEQILQAGDYFGSLRFMVGVHYPSDVQAGKDLGQELCQALLEDSDFLKDLGL